MTIAAMIKENERGISVRDREDAVSVSSYGGGTSLSPMLMMAQNLTDVCKYTADSIFSCKALNLVFLPSDQI